MAIEFRRNQWAVILGGSSGFGLATAQKLAAHGMSIAVVHRDRKGAMATIEPQFEKIRQTGVSFVAWNVDALSPEGRKGVLDNLVTQLGDGKVRVLMHSIAFGNLKLLGPPEPNAVEKSRRARALVAEKLGVSEASLAAAVEDVFAHAEGADALFRLTDPPAYDAEMRLEDEDMARTVYSMGTSLATWTQDLFARGMFGADARVLGMTSEGNEVAWRGYAAVSAAKAALEATARSIAVELAPFGVRCNIIQAGVTDTPALRLIPGSAQMKASARLRNPFGRLTVPADVANAICLLCTDEAAWINGTILRVDGGEHISG